MARYRLPRTMLALGWVSLLTDLSGEMIFPLLPVFLVSLGAAPWALGLMEGAAEAVASVLKVVSGRRSDRSARRKPLIMLGYGLSGAVRPLMGLAPAWTAVIALRLGDRVGKGLRTSPRDALIAEVVPAEHRGRAYGFHRAMDHGGAIVGPLVAAALLAWAGLEMRTVFLLAGIPALAAFVVVVAMVSEGGSEGPAVARKTARTSSEDVGGWRDLGSNYRRFVAALLVFSLGASTDAFLLLRLGEAGVAPSWIAIVWSAHHVVKMAANYVFGGLADRLPPRRLILSGWALYAAVYAGFAFIDDTAWLVAVFLVYGVYFGLTEPTERAWVASLAPARVRGTAFGVYHAAVGLASLPASLMFGLIWTRFGHEAAFVAGAGLAGVGAAMLLRVREPARPAAQSV